MTNHKEDFDTIINDEGKDSYVVPLDSYILTGDDFKELIKKAKKLVAVSLDYSTRKNNKYMVTNQNGKKVHFGSKKYADYLTHKDDDRRDKYLARATKIKNKQGELTYNNPESANFWSVHLLWPKK